MAVSIPANDQGGIRASTISTSRPAPILVHTSGVAGLPRGGDLSDRARSCRLLMRNGNQP
jgi:hypothetical protein